jgi:hypothetical protein
MYRIIRLLLPVLILFLSAAGVNPGAQVTAEVSLKRSSTGFARVLHRSWRLF